MLPFFKTLPATPFAPSVRIVGISQSAQTQQLIEDLRNLLTQHDIPGFTRASVNTYPKVIVIYANNNQHREQMATFFEQRSQKAEPGSDFARVQRAPDKPAYKGYEIHVIDMITTTVVTGHRKITY